MTMRKKNTPKLNALNKDFNSSKTEESDGAHQCEDHGF